LHAQPFPDSLLKIVHCLDTNAPRTAGPCGSGEIYRPKFDATAGIASVFLGIGWAEMSRATDEFLFGLSGTASDNVYAVGR
jgi:hypothetical protein